MSLTRLQIHRLRNIASAELVPGPHINFVLGENGSGKSSMLEAIHLIGRARSFRTIQSAQMIQFKASDALVTGAVRGDLPFDRRIGVRVSRQGRDLHLDERVVSSSAELVRAFPVQIIHPVQASLLDGSPRFRRQYLDWGVFHVEHDYLDNWRRFAKALNQRNAILKRGNSKDLPPWDQAVARYGTMVAEARQRYVEQLLPCLEEVVAVFFGGSPIRLSHAWGWKAGQPLLQSLHEDAQDDIRQGFTRSGPHRADLLAMIDGVAARTYLSRGQIKLFVYALMLAQASLVERGGNPVCVLIDDLASELDQRNRQRLLDLLAQRRAQCFITAVHAADLPCPPSESIVFHVEHGRIAAG